MTDMGPSPTQLRLYEQCRGLGWEHVRAARVAGLNPDVHPDYKPSPSSAVIRVRKPSPTIQATSGRKLRRMPQRVGKVTAVPPSQAGRHPPK